MKFVIIIVASLTVVRICPGQSIEDVWHAWEYKDTLLSDRINYWPNGKIKAIISKQGEILERRQFFENGNMQLSCSIVPYTYFDTVTIYNIDTYEEIIRITRNNSYMPFGHCKLYSSNGTLESQGTVNGFTKVGSWLYYQDDDLFEQVTYNSSGLREGPFISYYDNCKVKTMGYYRVDKLIEYYECYDPMTYQKKNEKYTREIGIERKSGTWTTFDEDGQITRVENY